VSSIFAAIFINPIHILIPLIEEEGKDMEIRNPEEIKGKIVYDRNNNKLGTVEEAWHGWKNFTGFFTVRPDSTVRGDYFHGSDKPLPLHNNHISNITENITLNKTIEELSRFWNLEIRCGPRTCRPWDVMDKPVCDRNGTKLGVLCTCVEEAGRCSAFGMRPDPSITTELGISTTALLPVEPSYVSNVTDTITLNKTRDELIDYWRNTIY